MYDWNDLRHFLAVARSGSTLGAAKALGVNQTTSARRIAALEESLGVRLFDRMQAGYRLTEAGEAVRADAERVEREAEALERRVEAGRRRTAGVIRVTTTELFANSFLTPCLVEFTELFPEIRIDVVVSDRYLDVMAGEADIAIRGGWSKPDQPGLIRRKLTDVGWGVYGSRDYVRRRGCPHEIAMLDGHVIIGGEGVAATYPSTRWLLAQAPSSEVGTRSNNLGNMMVAAKAGLGLAVLPCFSGDQEPELVRCMAPIEELGTEVWLFTTEQLKDVPRVRAFIDFIVARIGPVRARMAGRAEEVAA